MGESAAEAAIREVREETGVVAEIVDLLGVHTKYEQRYPNGDVAQPITVFFRCRPTGGALRAHGAESLGVRHFPLSGVPELFSQHRDAYTDLRAGRTAAYRGLIHYPP